MMRSIGCTNALDQIETFSRGPAVSNPTNWLVTR